MIDIDFTNSSSNFITNFFRDSSKKEFMYLSWIFHSLVVTSAAKKQSNVEDVWVWCPVDPESFRNEHFLDLLGYIQSIRYSITRWIFRTLQISKSRYFYNSIVTKNMVYGFFWTSCLSNNMFQNTIDKNNISCSQKLS